MAEAGVVRQPGNPEVVAPAAPGYTHLISTGIGLNEPLPAVNPNYDLILAMLLASW